MKTMQIQEWLDRIQRPDGTKVKIKNVLSAIFSHGVRWELVERNPVCGQEEVRDIAVLQPEFVKATEFQSGVWPLPQILFVKLSSSCRYERRRWRW